MTENSSASSNASAANEKLTPFVGEWSGTYRLWLEPGVLRTECPTRCTGRAVLDGLYVALDYDWTDEGIPQSGSMLIACNDDGQWEMAWVDTFHTAKSILYSIGGPEPEVLASYGPGWGWRTRFDLVAPDELTITAWNITPTGEEGKATEATYRR